MAAGAISSGDIDDPPTPTANLPPPLQSVPGAAAPGSGVAAPPAAAPAAPAAAGPSVNPEDPQSMIPQGQNTPGVENPPGAKQKGKIDTGPKVQFDPDKLAKVQTAEDLVNAMQPKSQNKYMDWWEKTHGEIDDKYDALQQKLGARPSDDEDMTRKEKFAFLLQYGLNLMKATGNASNPNQGAASAGALQTSIQGAQDAHNAGIKKQQDAYDANANAIEAGRTDELKGIGTPAAAMKGQMDADTAFSKQTRDNAVSLKNANDVLTDKASAAGPSTYSTAPDGTVTRMVIDPATGKATAQPVLGIDGQPYRGKILGRESGSGIDKGDPAAVKTQKYLQNVLGYSEHDATAIAMKPKTNSPQADWNSVYKASMQATGGDDAGSRNAANHIILENYGPGALAQANKPLVPQNGKYAPPAPPKEALQGLTAGMTRNFGSKGVWTVDMQGNPKLVRMPSAQAPGIMNPPQAGNPMPPPGIAAPPASP